ncbi:protein translocase subunit SecF [Roseateles sp.]|uniref:protein translocase subunit SecF n=1 Tax=Roseateles sp. TaxID=1971397 RepID=UPI003BA93ACE
MELFRIKRDIPFMKHALIFNAISFITFAVAVFFLITRGLHFSIEFTGGTVIEVAYAQTADIGKTRHTVEQMGYGEVQVQNFGSSRDVMIRLPVRPGEKQTEVVDKVFTALCTAETGTVTQHQSITDKGESVSKQICTNAAQAEPITLSRSEVVGPAVGEELAWDAAKALIFTVLGIVIYLAIRFEWKYGVAGVIANLHDVVIILGFFAFFQWEFSLAVLAAILAVLGYSVNESVVIFDRVREAFRKYRKLDTREVIDHAITSTMSRTIITHGSTQLVVLSMLLFGGPTLHYFAVALTIGILFGIYSSVFVAAALAMWLGVKREDLVKSVAVNRDDPSDPNSGAVV